MVENNKNSDGYIFTPQIYTTIYISFYGKKKEWEGQYKQSHSKVSDSILEKISIINIIYQLINIFIYERTLIIIIIFKGLK